MNQGLRVTLSCALLVGALLFLQFRSYGEAVPIRKSLDNFPAVVGDWREEEGVFFWEAVLNILKVKDYIMRRYVDPSGRSLWLYIGYWDTQQKGAQVHSPKNCLVGAGWEPLEASRLTIPLSPPSAPITVNRYIIQKGEQHQLVLYWYDSQGQAVASEFNAKLQLVKNAIFKNRTDGALVRITSPIYGSVQETVRMQIGYIQAMYPNLTEFLPD